MEKEIAKLIHGEKPTLSEMSVKTYANCIIKIMEFLKSTNLEDLYKNPNKVIKVLHEKYDKSNTIKTKIASIIVYLRCIRNEKNGKEIDSAIDVYSKIIDMLTNDIKMELSNSEKNTKQKENWLNKDDIILLDANLLSLVPKDIRTAKDLMNLRNYVLFKIYQDNPTRNELADTKIIFKPSKKAEALSDEYNYIILDKKAKTITYQMNQYKTSKNYGQKNVMINKDLYPLFLVYKKAIDLFTNENWFLLNDNASSKMTRNRLGVVYSVLGQSIGKKLGTSMNRHIQLSNLIPIKAIKDLTNKMGNSPNEALNVYAKN
tara:strand:- start:10563 stop:11513 length:951 start_codon:yes stop_codon:yes gene_type:complete